MKIRCHVTIYNQGDSFVYEFEFRPIKGDLVTYENVIYEIHAVMHNLDAPSKLPFVVLKKVKPEPTS